MRKHELLELIRRAMDAQQAFLDETEATPHPQVQEMVRVARVRLDALGCVDLALRGNATPLRILGEGARS